MAFNNRDGKCEKLKSYIKDWLEDCIPNIYRSYPKVQINYQDATRAILYAITTAKTRISSHSETMPKDKHRKPPSRDDSSSRSSQAHSVDKKLPNDSPSPSIGETREITPKGLSNFYGNCYMNSAIQCLSASTRVIESLDQSRESPELLHLMKSLRCSTQVHIDSSNFYNYFTSLNRDFYDTRGKDAAQFLSRIISGLTNLKKVLMIEQSFSGKCFSCGKFIQILSPNIFYILNPPRMPSTMYDLINNSYYNHEMESECECGGRAKLRMKISKLPEVLIIHINRYSRTGNKIETPVFPDLSLDVGMESGTKKYGLIGVICHLGTLRSGHYFAYTKHGRAWYECNDTRITKINSREVELIRDAYVLFYQAAI